MANNDITYVRPEVRAAMPVWKKIRDLCKGADAVKAAGNEYLPFWIPPISLLAIKSAMPITFSAPFSTR